MRKLLVAIIISVLVLTFAASCTQPTGGVEPLEFYSGNTITMVVPFRAGGGTDRIARVIARYLEVHTGANVIVETKSAAGGMEGHNYVYEAAKKDGLTVCVTEASAMWGAYLLGEEGVRYKIDEFDYLGVMQTTVHMLWVEKGSPINNINDLKAAQGLKAGVSGSLYSSGGLSFGIVSETLGLDVKIVPGFRGSSPTILALEKGEIDAVVFPGEGMQSYVEKGIVKPIFTVANDNEYAFFPEIPALGDLVELDEQTQQQLGVLGDLRGAKGFFITPGAPADRVQYLQDVFVSFADRADFQEEAAAAMGEWFGYTTGEDAADIVQKLSDNASLFPGMKALADKYSAAK